GPASPGDWPVPFRGAGSRRTRHLNGRHLNGLPPPRGGSARRAGRESGRGRPVAAKPLAMRETRWTQRAAPSASERSSARGRKEQQWLDYRTCVGGILLALPFSLNLMNLPYEWRLGWRYTRAGRGARRNGFISFISGVSVLGITLGVAALIIVLSVMNGFQKEVRDRMLSVIAHVEIYDAWGDALPDWHALATQARTLPEVVGAAPFVPAQALIAQGETMRGTMVRGIVPAEEAAVTPLGERLQPVLA